MSDVSKTKELIALTENVQRMYDRACADIQEYSETIKRLEAERDAALAAIEHVAALHVESDWKCGNPRHTNPEIGCPECYTECETCDRTYPCPTIVALDGAPEPGWEWADRLWGEKP